MTGKHRRLGIGCLVLGLLWLCSGQATLAQGGVETDVRGPIPVRNRRPYNLLFLQFTPESGDTLERRAEQFGVQLDVANNLLIPSPSHGATVVEDNEVQRLEFAWRRGVGHSVEVGVSTALIWRNGGFLDDLLSGYHSLFGFSGDGKDNPAGRDAYAKGHSRWILTDSQGSTLINQGNAFGLGETQLTVRKRLLAPSSRAALALRFGIKLPTGNPTLLLGSGSVDAGLSLDLRYSVGRDFDLIANAGGVLMGRAVRVPGAASSMVQGLFGLEYHPNRRDSYVFQIDGSSLVVRTGNSIADRLGTTATFGVQRLLDHHRVLTLSFSENGDIHNYRLPYLSGIGPDFTVSIRLTWRR